MAAANGSAGGEVAGFRGRVLYDDNCDHDAAEPRTAAALPLGALEERSNEREDDDDDAGDHERSV